MNRLALLLPCFLAASISHCAAPQEPSFDHLERLEALQLPAECHAVVDEAITVIEHEEELSDYLQCVEGAELSFDFESARIIVTRLDSDTRMLGVERDGEQRTVFIHTRHNSYPRGTPPSFYTTTYTIPNDGFSIEHINHRVETGQSMRGREVP